MEINSLTDDSLYTNFINVNKVVPNATNQIEEVRKETLILNEFGSPHPTKNDITAKFKNFTVKNYITRTCHKLIVSFASVPL